MTQHKCGVVAVIGAPNAGKSTLVNQLVGQKVAITSAKAQTTRAKMLGIALHELGHDTGQETLHDLGHDGTYPVGNNLSEITPRQVETSPSSAETGADDAPSGAVKTQMILVDTPGIFSPRRKLDRAMVSAAWDSTSEADAVLLLVDPIKQRRHELEPMLEALEKRPERKILVLNKVDKAKKEPLLELAQELSAKLSFEEIFFISALTGDGVPELKDALAGMMPDGPWHYPEDQVSDASERLLATEITREQLYAQLHEELPYDAAVRPESYEMRKDGSIEVRQQIVIAKASQKPIVLGKGGSKIKAIGEAARKELSDILGVKVHLFLHVKVTQNWDEDKEIYEEIGLDWG